MPTREKWLWAGIALAIVLIVALGTRSTRESQTLTLTGTADCVELDATRSQCTIELTSTAVPTPTPAPTPAPTPTPQPTPSPTPTPTPSPGVPSVGAVSGAWSEGATVTITGSGFGDKSTAQPVLFDDFEAGTVGAGVQNQRGKVGQWQTGAGSEYVFYSDAAPHAGTKSALHDFTKTQNASLSLNFQFTRLYMDFWMKVLPTGPISRNWKTFRFYGDNDNLQMAWTFMCSSQLFAREQLDQDWSLTVWGDDNDTYQADQWMHVQFTYQESRPNTNDGTVRHLVNGQAYGPDSGATMTQKAAAHFDQIRIGHYWAKDAVSECPQTNTGARVYTDDVYVDTSWARVELGSASTYDASTVRQVQVAKSWNGQQITIAAHPATLSGNAWLYVTEGNGKRSAGFPVSVQ